MMEQFIMRQRELYPLSNEGIELLFKYMEEEEFHKGSVVLSEGKREGRAYFIKSGLARAFVERDGKDVTLWFAGDGEMLVLTSQEVSSVNVEVSEDSVLYCISRNRLNILFEQSLELANWGRCLLEKYLLEYERYFTDYSWTSAQQQYEDLVRHHPDLLQKVPLKHLASYLQITPQSLSRIRSKIK